MVRRQIRISSVFEGFHRFPLFLYFGTRSVGAVFLYLQIGLLLSLVALGLPPSKGGQIPSICSLQSVLPLWNWSCQLVRRQIRISSVFEGCHRFPLFSYFGARSVGAVFSTAVKEPSRLSDLCFAVFDPNIDFKPVFKPVALNLESSYSSFTSCSSISVDCFWSRQNYFHLTTFF